MNPIHQLVSEVKSQKEKITELGQLIVQQSMMKGHPVSPSHATSGALSDPWEAIEMEAVMNQFGSEEVGTSPLQTGPGPSSSVPQALGPQAIGGKKPMKIAGINMPGNQCKIAPAPPTARAAHQVPPENNVHQVALTQAALEAWGQKVITWGKKCKGNQYVTTYEQDPGYVKWILARIDSLNEEMEDFANYCLTRRRLEDVARQQILS